MTVHRFRHSTILPALLVMSVAFGATAHAALEVIEEAYELNAEQILRWPLRAGDSLVVRPCAGCGTETLKVTEQTRYATGFDAPSISLSDLLRKKSLSHDSADHLIVVFYRPDDLHVTRIVLQTDL